MSGEHGIVNQDESFTGDDACMPVLVSQSRQGQPVRGCRAMSSHPAAPLPTDIESRIEEATRRLVEAAHPAKIVLFGSYARGDFDQGSDIDLLVILPTVESRFDEMVRLESALRGLRLPVDIIVYSANQVAERRHLRGTMLYHALAEGRVLYDAA